MPRPRKAADSYGTREVAELIGFQPGNRCGASPVAASSIPRVACGRSIAFRFRTWRLLRSARRLVDADVPVRRVFEALDRLQRRENVPPSLSAIRIAGGGQQPWWCAMTERCGRRCPVSAACRSGGREAAKAGRPSAAKPREQGTGRMATVVEINTLSSDDWYNLGLDMEEVDPSRAPEAYRRSIALDPANADAHVNLGRLYQIGGDLKRAKRHYRRAPRFGAGTRNLPVTTWARYSTNSKRGDLALDYYRRAASIPDAHYNLARIFGLRGDELSSLRHLKRYRQTRRHLRPAPALLRHSL